MSTPENIFAQQLEKLGFRIAPIRTVVDPKNTVYRQYRIEDSFFDFAIPGLRLLIEIDGEYWHARRFRVTSKQARQAITDRRKDALAHRHRWKILRINATKIEDAENILWHWLMGVV